MEKVNMIPTKSLNETKYKNKFTNPARIHFTLAMKRFNLVASIDPAFSDRRCWRRRRNQLLLQAARVTSGRQFVQFIFRVILTDADRCDALLVFRRTRFTTVWISNAVTSLILRWSATYGDASDGGNGS